MRHAALVATVAMTLAASTAQARPDDPRPRTPIEHFVVLMQENHSFDNYFGTYPGADGVPRGTCMPAGSSCVRPFHLSGRAVPDLRHDERVRRVQYAGGRMDGFVRGAALGRQAIEPSVMGHYDRRDLSFYWNVADDYVLFDRFFTSAADGGAANRVAWVAGRPGKAGEDLATIFDRLEARGVSWKFYVEDYDAQRKFTTERGVDSSAQALRVPLLNIPRYVHGRRLFGHIADLDEYYEDLAHGSLPAVAYIAPAGASEHPPGSVQAGEKLVRSLITALMRSPDWESSAFMWTYDEWGGWYDHVRPPAGRGFRVPALLVSPYARRGEVDGTTLETTSIPKFIEDNWRLRPLAAGDARANGFGRAFDFARPPRRPRLISATARPGTAREPSRPVIYAAYGAAIVLAAAFVGWAALGGRFPRRRPLRPGSWELP